LRVRLLDRFSPGVACFMVNIVPLASTARKRGNPIDADDPWHKTPICSGAIFAFNL
jgi:hypothetical protein